MTILSGQGTTAITVSIAASIVPSAVTVAAVNSCGTGSTSSLSITRKPSIPGALSGPISACGLTSASYSIAPIFGATSYTWIIPTGMTITSGATTTSINVNISSTFSVGNIGVIANNACGSTAGLYTLVTGKPPGVPGTLSGPTTACGFTSATYSIPTVAYATGYTWTVPSWMTIIGGAGTTSITVTATGIPAAGSVSVAATNACGTGTLRTLALTTGAPLPGAISGPTTLCGVSSALYSVASLGAGYTYNWTLAMTGWSIIAGAGTTSITISGPASGTSTSGLVKVTSTNSCGNTSGIRTFGLTYCHNAIANNNAAETKGNSFSGLYPNPASGEFKIDVTAAANDELTIQVYDILGNLIMAEKHNVVIGINTLVTDLENYKAGLYFVRLSDANAITVYSQTAIKN
jgi:hypothetical protein